MSTRAYISVSVQGVDRNLNVNGSYDAVDFGVMTLDQVIEFLGKIPKFYPPDILALPEYCPVHVLLETSRDRLSIALNPDGTFYVVYYDDVSGREETVSEEASFNEVLRIVKERIGREEVGASEVISYSIPVRIWNPYREEYRRDQILVKQYSVDGIPVTRIIKVTVKKGGIFSSPKIIIEYLDVEKNRRIKKTYELSDKENVRRHYEVLMRVLGPHRVVLK